MHIRSIFHTYSHKFTPREKLLSLSPKLGGCLKDTGNLQSSQDAIHH